MLKHFTTFEKIGKVLFYLWAAGLVLAFIRLLMPGRMDGYHMLWSYYMLGTTVALVFVSAVWMVASYLRRKRVGR